MGNILVRGFGGNNANQQVPRSMNMARRAGKPVEVYEGPVACTVMFDSVVIAFHDDPGPTYGRPYLDMNGKVSRVKPAEGEKFPGGVGEVIFGETDAPLTKIHWELTNEELGELAAKGLFGGDSQVIPAGLKPVETDSENPFKPPAAVRENMKVPDILKEVAFEGIPIEMNLQTAVVELNGRNIPIVVVTPTEKTAGKDGIIMSSPASGYNSLAQYFEKISLYEHGGPDARRREFVQMEDWLQDGVQSEAEIAEAIAGMSTNTRIQAQKHLSRKDRDDMQRMDALRHAIDEQVDIDNAGRQAEDAAAYEGAAGNKADELAKLAAERAAAQKAAEEAAQKAAEEAAKAAKQPPEYLGGEEDAFSDKDDEEERRAAASDAADRALAEAQIDEAKDRGDAVHVSEENQLTGDQFGD